MNTIIDNAIKSCEPLHEFWNKGGFVLCTAGEAEIRIYDCVYHLKCGSIFIVTPLIRIYEIKASDDFERISFVNELKVFYPIFKQSACRGIRLGWRSCGDRAVSDLCVQRILYRQKIGG